MTQAWRWCVVALVATVLVATPMAVRSLPVTGGETSTTTLLERARSGVEGAWSGTVETEGTLQFPDADGFSTVASLLGEQTRLRVWWHDPEHWRVDRLLATGERDLFRDGATTLEWDYERAEATVGREPGLRLPRPADLVPPVLAERLLRGATGADVVRLPARRLAGRSADGLRVRASSAISSVDHVDVWVDRESGVALLVEVHAEGAAGPVVTSRFSDFADDRPSGEVVTFEASATTDVEYDDALDIADAANQYAPVRPPAVVADLARTAASDRAVGVYGEGMTQLIAIPLRDRDADALRTQMAVTPGVDQDDDRTIVTLPPLGVLLTGARGEGGWLLAGTLTRPALEQAGSDVLAGFTYVDEAR